MTQEKVKDDFNVNLLAAHINMEMCDSCITEQVTITPHANTFQLFNSQISLTVPSNSIASDQVQIYLKFHHIQTSTKTFGYLISLLPDCLAFKSRLSLTFSQDLIATVQFGLPDEDFLIWYNPGEGISPELWTLVEENSIDTEEHTTRCTEQAYWTCKSEVYSLHLKHCCHFFPPKKSLPVSPFKKFFARILPSADRFKLLRMTVFTVLWNSNLELRLHISCSERPQPVVSR